MTSFQKKRRKRMEFSDDKRRQSPISDGEYIRQTDYKVFRNEEEIPKGAFLIGELLKRQYMRDDKLAPSPIIRNYVPRYQYPFNRHTVTIGVGNNIIDFDVAYKQHKAIQEVQKKFADEVEKVKEEMEKFRLIEQAWYDDFLNNTYINDLTLASAGSHDYDGACGEYNKTKTVSKCEKDQIEENDKSNERHILCVGDVVQPKDRSMSPFNEKVKRLPNATL